MLFNGTLLIAYLFKYPFLFVIKEIMLMLLSLHWLNPSRMGL